MRFCPNCGLMATDPSLVCCPKCGATLPPAVVPERPVPPPGAQYQAPAAPQELSMADYLLTLLVFLIPVAGFVMMLVWSFARSTHPARRRLAQAYLIRFLAVAVLLAILALTIGISLVTMLQASYWNGYYGW